MKKIEIIIDKDANVKVQTSGYSGSECKAITKGIEAAIGRTVEDRATEEMFRNGNTDTSIQVRS